MSNKFEVLYISSDSEDEETESEVDINFNISISDHSFEFFEVSSLDDETEERFSTDSQEEPRYS